MTAAKLKAKVRERMAITGQTYEAALRDVRQGKPLPTPVAFEATAVDYKAGAITISAVRR